MVAVAHPDVEFEREPVEQSSFAAQYLQLCVAVFVPHRRLDRSAQIGRDQLHSVTNAQDRYVNFLIKIGRDTRSIFVRYARGSARKYHTFWLLGGDLFDGEAKW